MSSILKAVLVILGVLFVVATVLPLIRRDDWWIRIFDFPRGQIAVAGLLVAVLFVPFWDRARSLETVLLVVLMAAVVFQAYRMFPYTIFSPKQVAPAADTDPGASFTLLISNVLMDNRAADAFVDLVRHNDPDIILAVETDDWWEAQLRVLEGDYPYTMKEPLGNTYGMLLYSRLDLVEPEVRYLIEDDIPSFHTTVRLPGGRTFVLHGLHPRPPYPAEDDDTTERDAELLLVGRSVKERGGPTVVAGDMNDVAWSHTTHLFQRVSGLLDPRVGRGMYSTFDARNPILRWPLDHVFHTDDFKLVRLERLPAWGSDHFPMLVRLRLDPGAPLEQEEPRPEHEDVEEAEEKIDRAVTPEAP